jgi:hypothetical protein
LQKQSFRYFFESRGFAPDFVEELFERIAQEPRFVAP